MKLLFVCLGNICRSPAAEASIRKLSEETCADIVADSCGVGSWHIGKPAYQLMIEAAGELGVDLTVHKARCIQVDDFDKFDFLIAMDKEILQKLLEMAPEGRLNRVISYLIDENGEAVTVPDPYYTKDFNGSMELILSGRSTLLERLSV